MARYQIKYRLPGDFTHQLTVFNCIVEIVEAAIRFYEANPHAQILTIERLPEFAAKREFADRNRG
jgi:hypothetical protein